MLHCLVNCKASKAPANAATVLGWQKLHFMLLLHGLLHETCVGNLATEGSVNISNTPAELPLKNPSTPLRPHVRPIDSKMPPCSMSVTIHVIFLLGWAALLASTGHDLFAYSYSSCCFSLLSVYAESELGLMPFHACIPKADITAFFASSFPVQGWMQIITLTNEQALPDSAAALEWSATTGQQR